MAWWHHGLRAVELPALQELSESEIRPLIAGDGLTTIGPFLRDMSASSSLWWDEVLNVAGALYQVWLNFEIGKTRILSNTGRKKGQKCSFPHEWKGVSKQGRCWTCGSTQHMKPDCPVKDVPKVQMKIQEDLKSKEGVLKGVERGGVQPGEASAGANFIPPSIQPSEDLVKEAVQLLSRLFV